MWIENITVIRIMLGSLPIALSWVCNVLQYFAFLDYNGQILDINFYTYDQIISFIILAVFCRNM